MSEAVLLRGGRVVDPSRNLDQTLDVLLRDGVVAKVDEKIAAKGVDVVDAAGLVVAPGFVDLHAHLREPGFEHKETVETGTRAAAAGGFTSVCAMANTMPVLDDAPAVAFLVRRIRETALVRVYPIGAVSKGLKGLELAEIGLMNEGWASTRLGLPGWPNVGESAMVARDVQLAALTKARLHVAHVSTRESLEMIRVARRAGIAVTCEVTPHHLTLTDEEVARSGYDTRFKMNPPLRSEADRAALVAALVEGTIDAVATDHAPHHEDEKALAFEDAPFGVTGLETALPVLVDALLVPRAITLQRLVEVLSTAPARVFSLPGGTLAEGAPADVVVFSTTKSTHVTPDGFVSRSKNSPWTARTLRGRVERTFVGGREVFARGAGAAEGAR